MPIILAGLNHRTAPVALRERLALPEDGLREAIEELQRTGLHEVVIVSTCNRLEIYTTVQYPDAGWMLLENYLAQLENTTLDDLKPSLYYKEGREAVHHLMRVAAGLDSMILGEPQILGQVNHAYGEAHGLEATGATLSRLFTQAVHAGKRARTETEISRHTTSVSHAAVRLAEEHVQDLTQINALVIGAGEMAAVTADALAKHNTGTITFINRTQERADTLADQLGACTRSWHNLLEALVDADLVISSTGAPHTVIHSETIETVLPKRNGRPLLLIDIAVPRDVEEAVAGLPGVILYDIDDLQNVLDVNMAQRVACAKDVERIINEELEDFMTWYQSREIVPVIVELRRKVAEIAKLEVQQALNRLEELSDYEQKIIDKLAHRIVNKILHEPTMRLKEQAVLGNGYYFADALAQLFDLEAMIPEVLSADGHPNGNGHKASVTDRDQEAPLAAAGKGSLHD
jgi:glutamyl-tRNA reductase